MIHNCLNRFAKATCNSVIAKLNSLLKQKKGYDLKKEEFATRIELLWYKILSLWEYHPMNHKHVKYYLNYACLDFPFAQDDIWIRKVPFRRLKWPRLPRGNFEFNALISYLSGLLEKCKVFSINGHNMGLFFFYWSPKSFAFKFSVIGNISRRFFFNSLYLLKPLRITFVIFLLVWKKGGRGKSSKTLLSLVYSTTM